MMNMKPAIQLFRKNEAFLVISILITPGIPIYYVATI